ncbi:LexA family transcriptional regulator [Achromobacter xylosoxidans]|uniref:LexA family transcriptional regulator n=1 Tax=Alcaligenes xylosoxydans xylosoxydans TaxID=85698 RepID=UPI001F12C6B3|nr:XRE family transcriptional regulator [Achromobacter xylosoxidans]
MASQEVLAGMLGFSSQSSVSQYLNGKIPLNVHALVKFADLFGCDVSDISPDLARDLRKLTAPAQSDSPPLVDSELATRLVAIRRVIFKVSAGLAGFSVEFPDNGDGLPLYLQRAWLEKKHIDPSSLYACRVSGASMQPRIDDGDVILINAGNVRRQEGAVYAVNHHGEFSVKRLHQDRKQWWLVSDNPDQVAYPPERCDDGTYLLGRVVYRFSDQI